MPPLSSHRRARRRSRSRRTVVLVCVAVVGALLFGGITQIGRQSGRFHASVSRSFTSQGSVLVDQSNATAATLRRVMATLENRQRRPLQAELDNVVAQASQQEAQATLLASTQGSAEATFALVFSERSGAVDNVRAAIDGLLGMRPLPIAGAPFRRMPTPPLLSATQATDRITAAGQVLVRSDRVYAALRRSLAHQGDRSRLPASTWVTAPSLWQAGAVATQVDLVSTSNSLAISHRLVLSVVKVVPPALPSASGVATPGVSVLSPTKSVTVSVVVTNLGSVDEDNAVLQFTLTPLPSGATVTKSHKESIDAARSVALSPVAFSVKAGTSYQLTVAVVAPSVLLGSAGSSLSEQLQIAPST